MLFIISSSMLKKNRFCYYCYYFLFSYYLVHIYFSVRLLISHLISQNQLINSVHAIEIPQISFSGKKSEVKNDEKKKSS